LGTCHFIVAFLLAFNAAAQTEHAKPEAVPEVLVRERAAAAAFENIVPVLRHPRCMNCHSTGDSPRQENDNHPHTMQVRRGPDGQGVNSVKCSTCHQDHNLVGEHMPPGAPDWRLPSPETPMIWEGLTDGQLCDLLKDPRQNGHRSIQQIVEHMSTPLVLWGWHPGEGRSPIPMPLSEFLAGVRDWAANGAACPTGTGASRDRGR
jgi:cytochrome c5